MAAVAFMTGALAVLRGKPRARGFVLTGAMGAARLVRLAAATVADARMLFPLLPPAIALTFAGLTRASEGVGRGRRPIVHAAVAVAALLSAIPTANAWRNAER